MLIKRSSSRFRGQRDYTLAAHRETRPTVSRRVWSGDEARKSEVSPKDDDEGMK